MKSAIDFRVRSRRANFIVELPLALWIIFILLIFPMISLLSMGYRATLVFFAVRDGAYQAAKAKTFTSAATIGTGVVGSDLSSNPGITVVSSQAKIVVKPLGGGAPQYYSSQLSSIDTTQNLYFLQINSNCTVAPILPIPLGPSSYPISFRYEVYAENPQGLIH